jgi:hypothetical protein
MRTDGDKAIAARQAGDARIRTAGNTSDLLQSQLAEPKMQQSTRHFNRVGISTPAPGCELETQLGYPRGVTRTAQPAAAQYLLRVLEMGDGQLIIAPGSCGRPLAEQVQECAGGLGSRFFRRTELRILRISVIREKPRGIFFRKFSQQKPLGANFHAPCPSPWQPTFQHMASNVSPLFRGHYTATTIADAEA